MKKNMIILSTLSACFVTLFVYVLFSLLNGFIFEFKNVTLVLALYFFVGLVTFILSMNLLKKLDGEYKDQPINSIKTKVKNYYRQNSAFQKKLRQSFSKK